MDIVIPVYRGFTALDAVGPYEVLSRLGRVRFVGEEIGPVTTETGMLSVMAEASLDEVSACDVLVVPGGPTTRALTADAEWVSWIARIHETTTWTTSVCTGSLLLGAAGLLRGVPATSHWTELETLAASWGAGPVGGRVVFAGEKIVTAAGVSAGIDMALTLAARIAGEDTARAIQLGIEYEPEPPFDSGSVDDADPALVAAVRAAMASQAAGVS
ncbi:DJ-1/PfpI family protein [Baekduia alba]|uniref:DJ-1/PfpI family protein n=1 Tax=Baekduia alba TaxID=2997333 RepID=UPI0032C49829